MRARCPWPRRVTEPGTASRAGGRHRSFAPTVLVGLGGAVLAAVAGSQEWARAEADAAGIEVDAVATGAEAAPLAAALSLVALASWGVVLVTRHRLRRVVAAVGAVASVAALVAVGSAYASARDAAVDALMGQRSLGEASAGLTGWYFVAAAGSALSACALVMAVRRAEGWPAMGARYDAPSARPDATGAEEDMWRSLDQGKDPTS